MTARPRPPNDLCSNAAPDVRLLAWLGGLLFVSGLFHASWPRASTSPGLRPA